MTSGGANNRAQIIASASNNSRTNLISSEISNKPIGISIFGFCFKFNSPQTKRTYHKALVLLLTYIAYSAFHMGRRPLSVVKIVLNQNCSTIPNQHSTGVKIFDIGLNKNEIQLSEPKTNCSSWAPFDNDETANELLAILDSCFLLSYALFMFISGVVAERMNLRYLITIGTVFSGLGLIAFGLAYPLDIHSLAYFVLIQIASGAAQTTGWPVVVTCVSNWFEPAKRGLIYGFWNSHTNLGNILGAVIAGLFVEQNWALSFIVPGVIMIAVGTLLFLFLVPTPQDVHLAPTVDATKTCIESAQSVSTISSCDPYDTPGNDLKSDAKIEKPQESLKAVSFLAALKIPGVIEYSFCLFFSKLVSYTFLYWLPKYISSSTTNNSAHSAYLSTPFDVGGITGAILAGYLSDKYNADGITCNLMFIFAIPSMLLYQKIGSHSIINNISLQFLVGALVNGPYCLITTSVSADLGNRIKDGHAMATVAAIIDGMGSIGAVLGPLFAGFVAGSGDWEAVFIMLMLADVFASLCIVRITIADVKKKFFKSTATTDTASSW